MTEIQVGDKVRWATPRSAAEEGERFTVVEVNGDRCFIRFVCDLPIPPTQLARCAELVAA